MRKYKTNANIIRVIKNLYDKAPSAVLFSASTELHSASDKGVYSHQLSLNIFLERIMCEALDDCEGSVSIGGRLFTKFHSADDIVINAEEKEEADVLVDHLDTTTTM